MGVTSWKLVVTSVLCLTWMSVSLADEPAADTAKWPVLVTDDFESGMERWKTSDVDKSFWELIKTTRDGEPTTALRVLGTSTYQPPHRSPHSFALVKDLKVSDFEMTVRVQNTNVGAGAHRDLCLFWGFQDPSHYYYVHFGAKPDPHSCQIFIVNDAPRTKITVDESQGTPWTDGWHTLRIVRTTQDGMMRVYFDVMDKPVMTAKDDHFRWGQVGIGTFDDHGNFDDFKLRGVVHP